MPAKPLVAIVDDDRSIRNGTRDLLNAAGFSTAVFADARSFLASASRATAACLVTDMRMPGMTGLELFEALVASGDGIPTVLITAHPEELTQSARAKPASPVISASHSHRTTCSDAYARRWGNRGPGLYLSLSPRSAAAISQTLRTAAVYLGAMSRRAARG